jgi:GNAT superfamily N-acetyltransferase
MSAVTITELNGLSEMLVTVFPLINQSNPDIDAPTFEARLSAMLEEGGYRCIAAIRDGAVVGVAGFWIGTQIWCGRYCEPDNLVVDEALRSGGIGKAMMDWIETEAHRLGCLMLKLETYAERTRARSFYRRIGYAEPGVVMVKTLPAPGAMTIEHILAKGRR